MVYSIWDLNTDCVKRKHVSNLSNDLALADYVAFGKSTAAPVLLTALSADCQICVQFPLDFTP